MLILTRRTSEAINIGKNIWVTVLGVKGQNVRLGISAPKEIGVHREEIFEKIMAEEKAKEKKRVDSVEVAK